jgi:ABC-type multidrug transport system fused ATPase/permease subunit
MGSLMWMVDIMRDVIFDWGMIKETEKLLVYEKLVPIPLEDKTLMPPGDGLGLYNVTFKYNGANEATLKNVSIYFRPGENVVLLGDIGSGKSTILKLLMRFYLPEEGDLFENGQWYSNMTTYQIRRTIGYVPQNPILFNRSIYDNIKYGNHDITNKQIEEIINNIGIADEFSNLENGLDTQIGKNGSKLSGGQKQLCWCLRVLLQNPDVILLDEVTASMDKKTKDLLFKMLDVIMKGKTVIMITHDDYLLKKADRKIYLKDGQISEYNSNKHNNI